MLRVHFLNVGHGDCTIIRHHSGRLTMVDINTSQDYDAESFKELVAEEAAKTLALGFGLGNVPTGFMQRPGGIGVTPLAAALGSGNALAALMSPPPPPLGYYEALARVRGELTDPIAFTKQQYPGQALWRFILTHPDLDHMRGITRLHKEIGFHNFWDTAHTKTIPKFRSDDDKVDWGFYQSLREGGCNRRLYTRGDSYFAFGKDENDQPGGDWIEILSPTHDLVRSCNKAEKSNDLSIVLRLWHAGRSVLLPGDAEKEAWDTMVSHFGHRLKSDFLKASHHGRDSGYQLDALKLIAPWITFVSVGRKPDTDASSKYRGQCERVASTRYHGNITLEIDDDGSHKWFVDRNPG